MTTSGQWSDTIVALATPPGIGAIGVVRLSGGQAFHIINTLFPSKDLSAQPSHTLHVGYLRRGDDVIDEVVVSLFKGPRSYTGEDVVEISGHGSPFVLEKIVNACVSEGARPAKPGEFTLRAFLNGKLDLTQAEAVADLIASNTAASHKTALHNIRGGFSDILKVLRERLIRFSALIELELDFSQEDVEFADRTQLYQLIAELSTTTNGLIESFSLGNVVKNGVSVAIVGAPNAGKSTLLNALLNENRAIVSEIAGTTRDTIEEVLNIDGILFRLIDTAGIRDHSADVIENMGIEKSLEKMAQAGLVIYLFDVAETNVSEVKAIEQKLEAQQIKHLLVGNKTDKPGEAAAKEKFSGIPHIIFIAAKEQLHLEALRAKMTASVLTGAVSADDTLVTNARHLHALQAVRQSLTDIKAGMDTNRPGDLLALDIRRCLHYLGEITGEITNEDQLDYIFSKFCIGK
jgi:tRNA modification GTPase